MDICIDKEYRNSCVKKFRKFIKNNSKCKILEESIFEETGKYIKEEDVDANYFVNIYENKVDEILANLDSLNDIKNTYFCQAILDGVIDVKSIACMSPEDMFPERWKKIIDRRNLIEYKKTNMATTDMFTCYKCSKKKCSVSQAQTRSADEPMTTFVKCLVCGNKWSF